MNKIAFIGRDIIFETLIEERYQKFDFHYTAFQDVRYSMNREVQRVYKVKNINLLIVDYFCLDTNEEIEKALSTYHAINPEVDILIVIFDRPFYSEYFKVIKVGNVDLKKIEIQEEEKHLIDKLKENIDLFKEGADQRKYQMKSSTEKEVGEIKEKEIKKKETKTKNLKPKFPAFSMPTIPKPNFNVKRWLPSKKENEHKPKLDLRLFKDNKIIVLYSDLPLQGVSNLAHQIFREYRGSCILDTNFSYSKYTGQSMEDYLKDTLLIKDFEKNSHNIYSIAARESAAEFKRIIFELSLIYDKVIIDVKDQQYLQMIQDDISVSPYYVIAEDYTSFQKVSREVLQHPNIQLLIYLYDHIFDQELIREVAGASSIQVVSLI